MAQTQLNQTNASRRTEEHKEADWQRGLKSFGLTGKRSIMLTFVAVLAVASVAALARQLPLPSGGVELARSEENSTPPSPTTAQTPLAPTRVMVHVDGAVASPGVYALLVDDARINDAVEAAGGLTPEAVTTSLNLAAPVEDGMKVHVPTLDETQQGVVVEGSGQAAAPNLQPDSSESRLININTADENELQRLNGIGQATAAAIVRERETNGPFSSPEDIKRVSGIGDKKYEKIAGDICV